MSNELNLLSKALKYPEIKQNLDKSLTKQNTVEDAHIEYGVIIDIQVPVFEHKALHDLIVSFLCI